MLRLLGRTTATTADSEDDDSHNLLLLKNHVPYQKPKRRTSETEDSTIVKEEHNFGALFQTHLPYFNATTTTETDNESQNNLVLLKNHVPYHEPVKKVVVYKDHIRDSITDHSSRTYSTRGETEFDDDDDFSEFFDLDAPDGFFDDWHRFIKKRERDLKDEQLQVDKKHTRSNLVEQMFADALGVSSSNNSSSNTVDYQYRLEDIIEDNGENEDDLDRSSASWMAPVIVDTKVRNLLYDITEDDDDDDDDDNNSADEDNDTVLGTVSWMAPVLVNKES